MDKEAKPLLMSSCSKLSTIHETLALYNQTWLLLHYDNARLHTSQIMQRMIAKICVNPFSLLS
jgi:hypothetical protein